MTKDNKKLEIEKLRNELNKLRDEFAEGRIELDKTGKGILDTG